jgi:hypothetical protein
MKENNRKERVENLGKLVIRGRTRANQRAVEGKFLKASWQVFFSLYWRVFMGLECLIMSGGWRHGVRVCTSHQFLSLSTVTAAREGFIVFTVTQFLHAFTLPTTSLRYEDSDNHLVIRMQEHSRRKESGFVSSWLL